jgi:hypothetical protein
MRNGDRDAGLVNAGLVVGCVGLAFALGAYFARQQLGAQRAATGGPPQDPDHRGNQTPPARGGLGSDVTSPSTGGGT